MITRRTSLFALLGATLGGCGGGSAPPPVGDVATPMGGIVRSSGITARVSGNAYPLSIYLPPGVATAAAASLPVVYLLDGATRFPAFVDMVEVMRARVMVVGIGNEALRGVDYVPANSCTPGGGGNGAFLEFIRGELVPMIETTYAADPARRILLGHSHGGTFVLYALFAQPSAPRTFMAYLAAGASIGCMGTTADDWESAYAGTTRTLSARVHLSYADNPGNPEYAQRIVARRYTGLAFASQRYAGGHLGMIPMAFPDALGFALG